MEIDILLNMFDVNSNLFSPRLLVLKAFRDLDWLMVMHAFRFIYSFIQCKWSFWIIELWIAPKTYTSMSTKK